jgi:hypothetical protein
VIILTHSEIKTLNEANIEKLFDIFRRDFIDNQTILKKDATSFIIDVKADKICPCPFRKSDKPERFWHIITKEEKRTKYKNNPCPDKNENNRKYDEARAKRIHWIKILIDTWQSDTDIKHFYQRRQSRTTLVIWHTRKDFVVIVRKLSNTNDKFLVSSYLIYRSEIKRYEKQLREYNKEKPNGLEWF